MTPPDLIVHNGAITTLDRFTPAPGAIAITAGRFSAVGDAANIMGSALPGTQIIDLGGEND
jgi:predicted amidohydrolase YtcJ